MLNEQPAELLRTSQRLAQLELKVASLDESVQGLESRVGNVENDVNAIRNDVAAMAASVASLRSEVAELRQGIPLAVADALRAELPSAMVTTLVTVFSDEQQDAPVQALRARLKKEQREAWTAGAASVRTGVLWLSPLFQFFLTMFAVATIVWGLTR